MNNVTVTRKTGLIIAAIIFVFTLTTVGQASARDANLKSMLSNKGISMKLVKLDRTDGFVYGLSFKGPKSTIVIAPGFARMFLVQTDGHEMILQADGTGNMQIIQADVDISYVLCLAKVVIGFLESLTVCPQGDGLCYILSIISLFEDVSTCAPV